MKIIAHRGYHYTWKENSVEALETALIKGYGFETDIRDYMGKLVISHNIAKEDAPDFKEFIARIQKLAKHNKLALNVKSDGLKELIKQVFQINRIDNYFMFDMSVPQMIEYRDENLNYYSRMSEYEKDPVLFESASGVWIDGFDSVEWIGEELVNNMLRIGKEVCIVSPELHHKEYLAFWNRIKEWSDAIYLCTDLPDEADAFFNKG